MTSRNNRIEKITLFLLFFTEMFSFKVGDINARYIVVFFWLFVGLTRCRRFKFRKYCLNFIVGLLIMVAYAVLIISLNGSGDFFIVLRLLRAIVTCITLYMFIVTTPLSKDQILDIVENILLLHAICIIMEIVFPALKDIVQPISQYDKEFMRLRAPGFLSGYDDAGLLVVIGLIINYFRNKANHKSAFTYKAFIYVVAVIFASRISMLLMMVMILYIIAVEFRNGTGKSKLLVGITLVLGGGVVLLFWILTTDVALSLREDLFIQFPELRGVYTSLMGAYTDYGTYRWQKMTRYWVPEEISSLQYVFGKGVWPGRSDIGYIKNIYATGMVSIVIILCTYVRSIHNVKDALKRSFAPVVYINNHYRLYLFLIILMLAMELKISIVFSSTSFELLSIIYFSEIVKRADDSKTMSYIS